MYFLPNSKYVHQDFKTADSHNQASLPIHFSEMVKQVCTETGLLTLKAVDANSKRQCLQLCTCYSFCCSNIMTFKIDSP